MTEEDNTRERSEYKTNIKMDLGNNDENESVASGMKNHLNALLDKIGQKDDAKNFETRSLNNFNRLNSLMNDMSNDGMSIKSNQSINTYDFKG